MKEKITKCYVTAELSPNSGAHEVVPGSAAALGARAERGADRPAADEVGRVDRVEALVERFDIEPQALIFQPNEQTLQGSFSSVSTPNFASKYSLESS